jgi:methionyl aminopeptidase
MSIESAAGRRGIQEARASDGWTIRTADGSFAAQYEHTIVITCGAPVVLTGRGA